MEIIKKELKQLPSSFLIDHPEPHLRSNPTIGIGYNTDQTFFQYRTTDDHDGKVFVEMLSKHDPDILDIKRAGDTEWIPWVEYCSELFGVSEDDIKNNSQNYLSYYFDCFLYTVEAYYNFENYIEHFEEIEGFDPYPKD